MSADTRTIYTGEEAYVKIDAKKYAENGEIEVVDTPILTNAVVHRVGRRDFEITYLTYLVDLFDKLGGKKYLVFKYILEHKSSENTLIVTTRELAEKTKTSRQTVIETLKILEEAGLIARRRGSIMLLPKVAHKGTMQKEAYLMQKFVAFDKDE